MVSIFVFISIVNTYNVNRQDMLYLITFPDRSKCHYINKYIVKQFDLLYNIVKYGLTVVEQADVFTQMCYIRYLVFMVYSSAFQQQNEKAN